MLSIVARRPRHHHHISITTSCNPSQLHGKTFRHAFGKIVFWHREPSPCLCMLNGSLQRNSCCCGQKMFSLLSTLVITRRAPLSALPQICAVSQTKLRRQRRKRRKIRTGTVADASLVQVQTVFKTTSYIMSEVSISFCSFAFRVMWALIRMSGLDTGLSMRRSSEVANR